MHEDQEEKEVIAHAFLEYVREDGVLYAFVNINCEVAITSCRRADLLDVPLGRWIFVHFHNPDLIASTILRVSSNTKYINITYNICDPDCFPKMLKSIKSLYL